MVQNIKLKCVYNKFEEIRALNCVFALYWRKSLSVFTELHYWELTEPWTFASRPGSTLNTGKNISYFIWINLILTKIMSASPKPWGLRGVLCVETGFYGDISQESRCNSEIKVWAHFYKIFVFLKCPCRT